MNHIRKILPFLRPYWKLAAISMAFLLAQVFSDLTIPRLIQRIIDQGITPHNMNVVITTSGIMLFFSLFSMVMAIGNNNTSIRVGEGTARDLREAIFVKIQSFAYGDIDHFTTGRLMTRLLSDTGAVQRAFQLTLRVGSRAPLMMIGSLILMFSTSSTLALSMVPLLLVSAVVIIFFSIKMEPLFRQVQLKLDRLNTVLQENIAGARLVKAFVRDQREGQRFEAANQDFTQRNISVMQMQASMSPILTMFINMGIVLVIYSGGLQIIHGSMTTGQIVAFTNYLLSTMSPLLMMVNLSNVWANGIASARRVNEVLDTVPEVSDDPQAISLPDIAKPRVTFENIKFHYNGSNDHIVLDGINLVAEPGQLVAILGATGSGKTTLANLIPRFYDPSQGKITIDGVDIREIKQDSLLEHVGIVPQETILFSGTIADNVRYGRADATEEQVIAAAKAAQAHNFITRLPQGYNTHVEERGVNLSGGQKQRIAIARALVTQPKILILDDSTSSVDVETETKIQDALQVIMRGRTSFVVAQRISTVLNADKIIVIDKGRIVAEGTHAELIKSSQIYQEIYDSQLGSGIHDELTQAELEEAENV
jgi:ATP-binding cassette subfamily B multidrug efflux pump